jgi:hypothetical protein
MRGFTNRKENQMLKINEMLEKIDPNTDYTVREVSKIVGLSYSCLIGHINRGNLPERIVFGKKYINGSSLLDYLQGRK